MKNEWEDILRKRLKAASTWEKYYKIYKSRKFKMHDCNELCELDSRFHDIQEDDVDDDLNVEAMRKFLFNRVKSAAELMSILDKKYGDN